MRSGRPIHRTAILFYCLLGIGCIGTDLVGEIPEDDGPSRIAISSSASAVEIGQMIQYEAILYHFDGSIDQSVVFEWVSSNSDVATVDASGSVSALSAGQAVITAHASGVDSNPLTLIVVADVNQVAIVQLTPGEIVLTLFETAQVTATPLNVRGESLPVSTVTYTNENASVASVSSEGFVTALTPGTTSIMASIDGVFSAATEIRVLGQEFSGSFRPRAGTVYTVSGTAVLQEQDTGSFVLMFQDNFLSSSGPGLHVFLSTSDGVSASSIDLGDLQSTTGLQSYVVGNDLDTDRYRWVIIHCVPFNVTFGSASLN